MLLSGLSGTNLKHAKDHNLRVTLQAIRLQGPVSRAELAMTTGLTPQAIAYISKKLITENLVMETGQRRGGRGQPTTEIAINPDGGYSIGVNIDRDHLSVILIDLSGKVRGRAHIEKNFMLPDAAFDWIETAFNHLVKEAGLTIGNLAGVGLAIPFKLGYLRLAITPPTYAAWQDYPSKARLEKITGLPVFEENDATASAIGESQYGHGMTMHSFFYLFFGYGLGGGLVINGRPVHGNSGHGGEIGHIPLSVPTAPGKRPVNIQDKVSLATLYASLEQAGLKVSDPAALVEMFESRPKEIQGWLEGAADDLLAALISINCLVNPAAILIGGRLPDSLIEVLIAALEKRLEPIRTNLPEAPPIMRAKCSTDAAALGAAIIPFTHILFPTQDMPLQNAS